MQLLEASMVYFALVFGLGFLLGAIRVPLLVPRMGARRAELLEMPFMLIGIVLAARFVLKQFMLPNTIWAVLIVGIVALSLVLIAEVLLVVMLQGDTIKQTFKNRDPISGSVYMLLLTALALMPLIIMNNR